jgi:hypothetical protein
MHWRRFGDISLDGVSGIVRMRDSLNEPNMISETMHSESASTRGMPGVGDARDESDLGGAPLVLPYWP